MGVNFSFRNYWLIHFQVANCNTQNVINNQLLRSSFSWKRELYFKTPDFLFSELGCCRPDIQLIVILSYGAFRFPDFNILVLHFICRWLVPISIIIHHVRASLQLSIRYYPSISTHLLHCSFPYFEFYFIYWQRNNFISLRLDPSVEQERCRFGHLKGH